MTYSAREISAIAFATLDKEPKITRIPPWLAKSVVKLIRPFNSQLSDLAEFIITAWQSNVVAPPAGMHTLHEYYKELAYHWNKMK